MLKEQADREQKLQEKINEMKDNIEKQQQKLKNEVKDEMDKQCQRLRSEISDDLGKHLNRIKDLILTEREVFTNQMQIQSEMNAKQLKDIESQKMTGAATEIKELHQQLMKAQQENNERQESMI